MKYLRPLPAGLAAIAIMGGATERRANITGHRPPRAGNIAPDPHVYSVALAGGGVRGGQVYGGSDSQGAFPKAQPCRPPDIHATIFHLLGISPGAEIRDMLGQPFPVSDGELLPLTRRVEDQRRYCHVRIAAAAAFRGR